MTAQTAPARPIKAAPILSKFNKLTCESKMPFEIEQFNKLQEFEAEAHNPDTKGFTTGFDAIDNALNKLQTGFHIVGGDSNMGKSGFVSHMAWNVSQLNSDAVVLDFSLDDPLRDKIPRVVAASSMCTINSVRDPASFEKYPEMIKRRDEGMAKLFQSTDRYIVYDSTSSCMIEDIEKIIKSVKIDLAQNGVNKRLCVFIDNFHDLDSTNPNSKGSDKAKYDYIAQYVSDMATRYDIPIVCTAEFRKLNGYRRPTSDDIREAVKIKYEAKSIMLIYNEVSAKGEAAQIFFQLNNRPEKQPIFEVKFAKNKYTSFKGRCFFYFYPEMSYFRPVSVNDAKTFNQLLFSNGI